MIFPSSDFFCALLWIFNGLIAMAECSALVETMLKAQKLLKENEWIKVHANIKKIKLISFMTLKIYILSYDD